MSYPYDGSPAGNEALAMRANGIGPNGIHLLLEPEHIRLAYAIAEADLDGRVEDAWEEGFEEGESEHADDYAEGHDEGYELGYEAGLKEGQKRRNQSTP